MHSKPVRVSPFDQIFDAVVVGSGYAGFAAALTLNRAGRSVLLIGPTGDLIWESGRAFAVDPGRSDQPIWRELCGAVAQRGGYNGDFLDGAIAEVIATDMLFQSSVVPLYYARPVAVETENSAIAGLIVATKSGLKRVVGRQWIDATDEGDLIRLASPGARGRAPTSAAIHLYFQHAQWHTIAAAAGLRETVWATERVVTHEVSPTDADWRLRALDALTKIEETLGDETANAAMSHFSFEPLPMFVADTNAARGKLAPSNLVSASPAFSSGAIATPADRLELGVRATGELSDAAVHELSPSLLSKAIGRIAPVSVVRATVCVAGTGTGGTLGALAAAKAGANVLCIDPSNFAGGIGVGGGIHFYYFGVAGGLQQQVDQRTRDLMKKFRGGPLGEGYFNPWAKMITLQTMLAEAGVKRMIRALMFGVETRDSRVTAVLVATPEGVVRIEADSFVDGTGDGDLSAMAGAAFTLGREHDGVTHAYSQSSGVLRSANNRPRMNIVNYDAGFCDPTDVEDLTRARIIGIRQYLRPRYQCIGGAKEANRPAGDGRPTYLAPAIGLRQARQIVTEYVLTLDDQIRGRTFSDPIGYTGCHYDNHATDYEFESDEAMFWVWVNRSWRVQYAGQMSYRMIVPRGLKNVWIASRCVGVSQDAHHSTRMQRDVQRVGEAAGFAAAEAAKIKADATTLPYESIKRWLNETGALAKQVDNVAEFGCVMEGKSVLEGESPDAVQKAIDALDRGEPGAGIWRLYMNRAAVESVVISRLESARPMTSWLAACVMAMWNMPAAEARLIRAVATREFGFEEAYATLDADGKPLPLPKENPTTNNRAVPNWLVAIAMLRRVGTPACLDALAGAAAMSDVQPVNLGTTIALTVEQIAKRGLSAVDQGRAERILNTLLAARVAGRHAHPQRMVGKLVHDTQNHAITPEAAPEFGKSFGSNVIEDNLWQLHLAVARARAALSLAPQSEARGFANDPRALVRRAFAQIGICEGRASESLAIRA